MMPHFFLSNVHDSASLRSMLLAESSGGSSSRWGRSQRGQDEADGEGGWEYDGGGDDDEEDEEEEEDPEVRGRRSS